VTVPGIPEASGAIGAVGVIAAIGAAAGLMVGTASVWLHRRARSAWRRDMGELRLEMERVRVACLAEAGRARKEIEEWKRELPANTELVCDGRLSATTRSRAMRMLRAGATPAGAAAELGIARSEVRLLQEVAAALTQGE
jgi:hypothetical protein